MIHHYVVNDPRLHMSKCYAQVLALTTFSLRMGGSSWPTDVLVPLIFCSRLGLVQLIRLCPCSPQLPHALLLRFSKAEGILDCLGLPNDLLPIGG
ncbi:hypothetical protein ACOSQ3_006384 [Xanthoceras sorbifolium]